MHFGGDGWVIPKLESKTYSQECVYNKPSLTTLGCAFAVVHKYIENGLRTPAHTHWGYVSCQDAH
jgi:hypothetical protein